MQKHFLGKWLGFVAATLLFAGAGFAQVEPAQQTTPARQGVWGDIVYGDINAPVELIEYASMTCPHCADFSSNVLPRLMEDFINEGKLRFVLRNFVRDRYDLAAAAASRCMPDEATAKRAIADLFAEQDSWLRSDNPYAALAEIVARHGLTQPELGACLSDQEVREHIVQMTQTGAQVYNIQVIPTLVLNGVAMTYQGYESLKLRIEAQLGAEHMNTE